jgi:hypothetical protein
MDFIGTGSPGFSFVIDFKELQFGFSDIGSIKLHVGFSFWRFFTIGFLVFHWEIEFKRDNLLNIRVWDFGGFLLDGSSLGWLFVRIIGGFSIGCWIAFT